MAGVLDSVNQHTQLAGQNRLELVLFRLDGGQLYGINVFKVREVLQCPALTIMPRSNPVIRGVASIRGTTLPFIDLGMATGKPALELQGSFAIIAEYNNRVLGFLVRSVERIVNLNWEEILPPPTGAGHDHYLTAVTHVEDHLVEVLDVEKVLAEVAPASYETAVTIEDEGTRGMASLSRILIVDDSAVARKQVVRCLENLGVEVVTCNDGQEALVYLQKLADEGKKPSEEFLMMISDIEMPEMDGYTLTRKVRQDPRMQDMHVLLHTSLSGVFNQTMVKQVGADDFLAKFQPDDLATRVIERIRCAGGNN